MKILKLSIACILFGLFVLYSCTEEPGDPGNPNPMNFGDITEINNLAPSSPASISGDLADGEPMDDLNWAANSAVACFPMTRAIEFEGNQLYYKVDLPQGQEITITVTPTGERKRINLYGYINFDGSNTPPVSSVVSCEAGYELYTGTPDLTKPGEAQSISFAQAVNRDFTVFICVSGAQGVNSGSFDLDFELEPL